MTNPKSKGRRTNDRVNVGVSVAHHKSHSSVKSAAGGSGVLHNGQPTSYGSIGGRPMTGNKGTNL